MKILRKYEMNKKSKSKRKHIHKWRPLSSDPLSSDVCKCGAEKVFPSGKIYEPQVPKGKVS